VSLDLRQLEFRFNFVLSTIGIRLAKLSGNTVMANLGRAARRIALNSLKRSWKLHLVTVIALTLLIVLTAPAIEASSHRMRVHIDESFELNGVLHRPNVVTVREVGAYSPTSVFAEICVGNRCVGRLIAHESDEEGLSEYNSLVFDRNREGHLVLVGIGFRGQPTRMLAVAPAKDAGTDATAQTRPTHASRVSARMP